MARPRKVSVTPREDYTGPREIKPQAGFQEKFVRSNVDCAFGGGVLNPQPLTSHILTPSGFKQLSEIKTGDIVLGLGNKHQVITHCDREGEKDCIRVVLEDGSSAESALDHKWWIMKDGQEMTAISFELLESFQIAKEKGTPYNVYIFRYIDGKPIPVKLVDVIDIGKREVVCLGVSNEDELYITDDYLITKNCGKAQPLDAKVLTPSGYTTIGALREGDTILDVYGKEQTVERIYEKGKRYIYEVGFEFGSVRCCEEHLWRVFEYRSHTYMTMTLGEIMMNGVRGYGLPCAKPLSFNLPEKFLPLDPYVLGKVLSFGHADPKFISDNMRFKLEQIGIKDEFFIPDDYKWASLEQRQELFRGYIDGIAGAVQWKRKSATGWARKRLAEDLSDLVGSLGGVVMVKRRRLEWMKLRFVMPRVASYASATEGDFICRDVYPIKPIRYVKMIGVEPARCILVSSPKHLYITDHFTVTHNTFAAILMVAEPSLDPAFRAAFTRRNLGNLKQGGGIVDDFQNAYGDYVKATTSDNPRISFPSGAFVDCLHIADEEPNKLTERAKGWQYDCFYLDELTSYEFSTFSIVGTRCRGKAKWTGKIRGTTNPKRSHWTRKMLDWYIGPDGFVRPDRDGVVRYYYQNGDTVEDIVWGDSPDEVYRICKVNIDRQLEKLGGSEWTYANIIRTFVFYAGKMSENKASIGNNASYIGAVAAVGGKRAQQLIEGNFNVDEDESDEIPISSSSAQKVFVNDECRNGDRWITIDLADVGTDNVIVLQWDGLHVEDMLIIKSSTPRMNYEKIKIFATRKDIPETHIIYDATHAAYMLDYMPDAIPFVSAASTKGLYSLAYDRLKDECYGRLIDAINNGRMSFADDVSTRIYHHQKLKQEITVQAEFLAECSVVRLRETNTGKKKLWGKKEMNAMLGNHRSMDLLDPCAMRMYPLLTYQYGDELSMSSMEANEESRGEGDVDVYNESFWS